MTNNEINKYGRGNIKFILGAHDICLYIKDYHVLLDIYGEKGNIQCNRIYEDIIEFNKYILKTGLKDYIDKGVKITYAKGELRDTKCSIEIRDFIKGRPSNIDSYANKDLTGAKLQNLCKIINKIGYFTKDHGSEHVSEKLYAFEEELKNHEVDLLDIIYSKKQIETEKPNLKIMVIKRDWLGAL